MYHRYLPLLIVFLAASFSLVAQRTVTILDLSPGFGRVTVEELTMVSITNTSTTAAKGQVVATLTETSGAIIAELRSSTLTLDPGESTASVSVPWSRRVTYGQARSSQNLARTGILGFGDFGLCFEFVDENGTVLGRSCTEKKSVPALDFALVYPLNKSTIVDRRPVLNWEDVRRYGIEDHTLSYSLTLVAVEAGQSAAEALEKNIPLLRRELLRSNSLLYPIGGRQLKDGGTYAWRVVANAGGNELISSQQWVFQVATKEVPNEKPTTASYAMLDTKQTNRYFVFENALHVAFDNNERVETLDYRITSLEKPNQQLKALPAIAGLHPGLNTLDIPIKNLGLQAGERYQLEVRTPRGQSYFLQFRTKSK